MRTALTRPVRRIPYFTNIWNMLEVSNITPFVFAWTVRLGFLFDLNRQMYKAGMFGIRYAEIGTAAASYSLAFCFDSISILTSFLKLFKYFRLSPLFALLWNVLERAAADIGYFFFMLIMFLIAFSIFAEQMFGLTLGACGAVRRSCAADAWADARGTRMPPCCGRRRERSLVALALQASTRAQSSRSRRCSR